MRLKMANLLKDRFTGVSSKALLITTLATTFSMTSADAQSLSNLFKKKDKNKSEQPVDQSAVSVRQVQELHAWDSDLLLY